MARVLDKEEGMTFTLLPNVIGLAPYRRHPEMVGEGGIGLVCRLSYRKSVEEIKRVLGTEISKTTLHRQVQELVQKACDCPDLKEIPTGSLW